MKETCDECGAPSFCEVVDENTRIVQRTLCVKCWDAETMEEDDENLEDGDSSYCPDEDAFN